MKTNFKCPKCHKNIAVGKRLHASYHCCYCHYPMVLTKQDVSNGTVAYKPPYWVVWGNNTVQNRQNNRNFHRNNEKSFQK